MNKSELIEALAVKKNISQKKSEETINILLISITNALEAGERVEVRGFGSFVVRDYNPYVGRNPRTGEAITVKSKKLPFFKVGKELKEKVDC
ncbi:MAG: integration host factor subunit beta [Dehalobacter sp.]|nr:integration host factor subunit beta [Dehalobacter sp.]